MQLPEEAVLKINVKYEVAEAAQLEAMMTFMKQETNHPAVEKVYLYPEYVKDQSDLFYFAMIFGQTLVELKHGLKEVPEKVKQMFASHNN